MKKKGNLATAVVGVSASLLMVAITANSHAATLYWDGDGIATGNNVDGTNLGGNGTWNQANTIWWDGSAASDTGWGALATNLAVFRGTAGTVTMGATLPTGASGLEFDVDGYLITSSTLTLATGTSINTVGSTTTATVNSIVAANTTGTWAKDGAGKLILGGSSDNTGGGAGSTFNLNDGAVELNKSGTALAINSVIVNVGEGTGATGSASLKLTGASTNELNDAGVMNLKADGTFDLNGKTETIGAIGAMSGGSITTASAVGGKLILNNAASSSTVTGANTISAALQLSSTAVARTRTFSLTSSGDTLVISGAITEFSGGAGTLQKSGLGTLTLSNAGNAYTGSTTISDGTLLTSASNVLPSTSLIAIGNVATARLNLNGTTQSTGSLSGGGTNNPTIDLGTNGVLTIGNDNVATPTFTGVISGSGASLVKTGSGNQALGGTTANTFTGTTTVSAGTLTLSKSASTNALAGNVVVANGAFLVQGSNGEQIVDSATLTLQTGSTFKFTQNRAETVGISMTDATVDNSAANSTLILTSAASFSGSNTIGSSSFASALQLASAATGDITRTFDVVLNKTLTFNSTLTQVTGVASITKTGVGTMVIAGSGGSTVTGAFNLKDGTVNISKSGGTGISSAAINIGDGIGDAGSAVLSGTGASADQIGDNTTININTDGVWNRNSSTDTIGNIGSITGQTIGGGALTINIGPATTNVSGANTISADLNTATGSNRFHTWSFASATDSLTFSGQLLGNQTASQTFIGPVGSTVTISGSSSNFTTATNAFGGLMVVTGSTLLLNKSGGAVAIAGIANSTLTVNGGGTIRITGGSEQLGSTAATGPVLVLGGNGGTAVTGGTFDLNSFTQTVDKAPSTFSGNGVISSSSGVGLLIVNSSAATTTTATGTGNVISANLQLTTAASRVASVDPIRTFSVTNANDTLLISGAISNYAGINGDTGASSFGAVAIQKSGSGTLTVSGPNTYVGATKIGGGILSINQDGALGAVPGSVAAQSIVFSGGTLQATENITLNSNRGMGGPVIIDVVNGKTLNFAGVMAENNSSGSGFTKTGAGTYSDNQAVNVYSGATTLKGGVYNVTSLTNGFGVQTTAFITFVNLNSQITLTGADTAAGLGLAVGMNFGSSNNVPAGATIVSIDSPTKITLSAPANSSSSNHAGVFGNANSLGFAPNSPTTGLILDGGLLGYNGSVAGSTNRDFGLTANGGGFSASGSTAAATMTITGAMTPPSSGTQSLTLAGTNAGNNTISTLIKNGTSPNTTSVIKSGTGKWILTNANTYTAGTTISGGTLLANNTTGSATGTGAVIVQSNGKLGGSGTVSGAVTVNSSGLILGGTGAAGTTLTVGGGLTMETGSVLQIALGSGLTHGTLTQSGGGTWIFDGTQAVAILELGVGAVTENDTFDNVVSGLSADPGSLSGWHITNPNWSGTFTYDNAGGIDLKITAVPEPTSISMVGFGMMAGLLRRRRAARRNESAMAAEGCVLVP